MPSQLILPMGVDDAPGIANYLDTPNPSLVLHLQCLLQQQVRGELHVFTGIFIWGEQSAGKSHLLTALSQWAQQYGGQPMQLDLVQAGYRLSDRDDTPEKQIYLLDDIENYIADAAGERHFLTLIERIKQRNAMLLVTAGKPVRRLGIGLPDLSSRLQAMDSFELRSLGDEGKRSVLLQRARQRGIVLSDEVLSWLFTHTSRDLTMLLELLDWIDVQSLAQKRKVTIPLIKSILQDLP